MKSFESLGLQPELLKAIGAMGFENPTPIQEKTIPVFLNTDKHILALAQTGTGKTAAFGLPLLQLVDTSLAHTQALILCPTRELCLQITRDIEAYSANSRHVKTVAVYGGSSISTQITQLKKGAHIIVATPGRLMDLMERKAVKIQHIAYVVLDEADEMLNMGFREDIELILSQTPDEKRVCLFSATMPSEVREIADIYLEDPEEISAGKKNSGNANIEHQYAVVHAKDKYAALKRVLDYNSDDFYGIIFCTTRIETQEISDKLIKDGYNADCLHGELSQQQREKVMHRFRHKSITALLATDVAARGIDVSNLTHVIHYHLPDETENYTHRSGRTGRAGKTGISLTLLNMREAYRLREIERKSGIKFSRVMIPMADQVMSKKIAQLATNLENAEVNEKLFTPEIMTQMSRLLEMPSNELVKKILTQELKRFAADYLQAPDLNASDTDRGKVDRTSALGTKLFISLGSKDGFSDKNMQTWIEEVSGIPKTAIQKMDVKGVYSFAIVKEEFAQQIIDALHGGTFKDRPVRIEQTGNESEGRSKRYGGGGGSGSRSGGYGGGGYGGGDRKRSYSGGGSSGGDRKKSYSGGGGDRDRGGDRGGYGKSDRKTSYSGKPSGKGDKPARKKY